VKTSNGGRGEEHTILLGSRPPSLQQGTVVPPSRVLSEQPVSVGQCVNVTDARDRLSGPALGTVLGSGAPALAAARLPSLRLVSVEGSLTPLPDGKAPRRSSMDATPLPSVVPFRPVPRSTREALHAAPTVVYPPGMALPGRSPALAERSARRSEAASARPSAPVSSGPSPHVDSRASRAEPNRLLTGATPAQTGSASRRSSLAAAPSDAPPRASDSQAGPAAEAAAAEAPEQASPVPRTDLFRQAALDARSGAVLNLADAAEPKLGAWGMLVLLLSLVAALFCGAALLSVEVTVRAPGALRAPNGLRSVESVLSGAVTEVLVQAGDEVNSDQIIARLEETQLRATLTLRERELANVRHDIEEANRADAALLLQTTSAVDRQRAALARRSGIHQNQLRARSLQLENVRAMREHGVASGTDELSGEESVQAAAESIALVGSQLAELNLSLADRQREWKQRGLERNASLSRAIAAVDEAKSLLALTEVRSPASGRVESLLVAPGAVVQPGRVIAQIVPKAAPRSIVAFLPSREMAFVSVGSQANVEIESLPVNEFGMARSRVRRISADIAKPEEIQAAFGEVLPGSFVRVELDLVEDANQAKMAPHLRSGERVLVRLHRREQRVLSLIFEFTRKWLGW
jgi:multidrug resistance efflux pump